MVSRLSCSIQVDHEAFFFVEIVQLLLIFSSCHVRIPIGSIACSLKSRVPQRKAFLVLSAGGRPQLQQAFISFVSRKLSGLSMKGCSRLAHTMFFLLAKGISGFLNRIVSWKASRFDYLGFLALNRVTWEIRFPPPGLEPGSLR